MGEKAIDYKEVIEEANERFEQIQSDDKDNRDNYKADLAFVYSPGSQWPSDVRALRNTWKELCLEFNQLKQFVAQVVNDQLQNRPGIRVHPAGGDASEEVAEIEQGMIRGIENDSKADDVYKNAFKLAVAAGRGWWRVVSEWVDNEDTPFIQKLVIKPIQDSNTVYADLDYEQPDGSDRKFVFVATHFSKEEFIRKWPNKDPVSWETLPPYWQDGKDSIVVADYYRRVCEKRTMVLMTDGNKGWKDELPPEAEWPEGVSVKMSREVETYKVEWYTIAGGQQVLEKYEWPGSIIPVICTAGEDIILEGKRVYQGLTRHARDAQSMLNFGMTQQATQLALSPRAPWVAAEGQIEGYKEMWRDANQKNYSTLIYKPTTIEGQLAPPPQRTQPAMVSEGWDRWCQTMIGMIKSTIGMYEQSLGQKGNEVSGRAITAREKQGDTATFNFVNNWHMAIELTGRIIVECLPTYYDTERIVTTIGPDDVKKLVPINQTTPDPDDPLKAIKNNDITKGKYAVTVEAGPSFSTKRQETSEALQNLVQGFPKIMDVAGDLVVKSLDIADADILAERLKSTLPPQILQAEQAKEQGKNPPDPQMMAELQQKDQHLQQAVATMDEMHKQIQELKSGAMEKIQSVKITADAKRYEADLDYQFRTDQAQRDYDLEIKKTKLVGLASIEREGIAADGRLQVSKVGAEKDLIISQQIVPQELTVGDETGEESKENEPTTV